MEREAAENGVFGVGVGCSKWCLFPFQEAGTMPWVDKDLGGSLRVGMEVWKRPIWIFREGRA